MEYLQPAQVVKYQERLHSLCNRRLYVSKLWLRNIFWCFLQLGTDDSKETFFRGNPPRLEESEVGVKDLELYIWKNFDNSECFSEITKAFNCYQDRLREDNPQAQQRAGSHNHLLQNQSCLRTFYANMELGRAAIVTCPVLKIHLLEVFSCRSGWEKRFERQRFMWECAIGPFAQWLQSSLAEMRHCTLCMVASTVSPVLEPQRVFVTTKSRSILASLLPLLLWMKQVKQVTQPSRFVLAFTSTSHGQVVHVRPTKNV